MIVFVSRILARVSTADAAKGRNRHTNVAKHSTISRIKSPKISNTICLSLTVSIRPIDPERIVLEPDPLTPALSQRERGRIAARKINPFPGRINNCCHRKVELHCTYPEYCRWRVALDY